MSCIYRADGTFQCGDTKGGKERFAVDEQGREILWRDPATDSNCRDYGCPAGRRCAETGDCANGLSCVSGVCARAALAPSASLASAWAMDDVHGAPPPPPQQPRDWRGSAINTEAEADCREYGCPAGRPCVISRDCATGLRCASGVCSASPPPAPPAVATPPPAPPAVASPAVLGYGDSYTIGFDAGYQSGYLEGQSSSRARVA